MPPLPSHLRKPLTRRFQLALAAIGARSTPSVARAFNSLATYNEDDIETFATKTAPTLRAAKFSAVRQAAGYYALTAGVRAVGVKADEIPVEPDSRAPFIATWLALKNGAPFQVAVEHGASRLSALVDNLVTSSARQTGDIVVERAGLRVVAWERIPDGNACPWCREVAPGPLLYSGIAGYTSAESADFGHDRCGCTAAPIFEDEVTAAPGAVPIRLEIGLTTGDDLRVVTPADRARRQAQRNAARRRN